MQLWPTSRSAPVGRFVRALPALVFLAAVLVACDSVSGPGGPGTPGERAVVVRVVPVRLGDAEEPLASVVVRVYACGVSVPCTPGADDALALGFDDQGRVSREACDVEGGGCGLRFTPDEGARTLWLADGAYALAAAAFREEGDQEAACDASLSFAVGDGLGDEVVVDLSDACRGGDDQPANGAPTSAGLADVTVAGDDELREVDLSSVFQDPDGDELLYAFTVAGPAGNVTAALDGATLTLWFPSRLADPAEVTVTATDPQGASVTDSFAVGFEGGTVTFAVADASSGEPSEVGVQVMHLGATVATTTADRELTLRAGEYTFVAELVETGTYVDTTYRGETGHAVAGPAEVVQLDLQRAAGGGRLWLPVTNAMYTYLCGVDDSGLAGDSLVVQGCSMFSAPTLVLIDVARSLDGTFWLAGSDADKRGLWRLQQGANGDPTTTAPTYVGTGLTSVTALAFGPDGDLWVSGKYTDVVLRFPAEQVREGDLLEPDLTIAFDCEFVKDWGCVGALAVDAAGNLWVGTDNVLSNHIYRFDAAGLDADDPQPSLTIKVDKGVADLAFGANGDLWFATGGSQVGRVPADLAYATDTDELTVWAATYGKTVTEPTGVKAGGLAFDSRGNLWLGDESESARRLIMIAADDLGGELGTVTATRTITFTEGAAGRTYLGGMAFVD